MAMAWEHRFRSRQIRCCNMKSSLIELFCGNRTKDVKSRHLKNTVETASFQDSCSQSHS